MSKAHAARAFGADYIANILRQQQQRREVQPPLRLRDPALNEPATDPLSLAEYDAFILRSRKESRDTTAPETESAQEPVGEKLRAFGLSVRANRSVGCIFEYLQKSSNRLTDACDRRNEPTNDLGDDQDRASPLLNSSAGARSSGTS